MMRDSLAPSKQFDVLATLPFLCQEKQPDAPVADDSAPGFEGPGSETPGSETPGSETPGSETPGDRETEGNLTPEDEQIVLERLRQLGYVE